MVLEKQLQQDYYWGFAGTRLLTGCALLRVVFTGRETLYGEIIASTVSLIDWAIVTLAALFMIFVIKI